MKNLKSVLINKSLNFQITKSPTTSTSVRGPDTGGGLIRSAHETAGGNKSRD